MPAAALSFQAKAIRSPLMCCELIDPFGKYRCFLTFLTNYRNFTGDCQGIKWVIIVAKIYDV